MGVRGSFGLFQLLIFVVVAINSIVNDDVKHGKVISKMEVRGQRTSGGL